MFQCLVLTARGDLHLLTRAPDLRQARHTSTLDDDLIHIWAKLMTLLSPMISTYYSPNLMYLFNLLGTNPAPLD